MTMKRGPKPKPQAIAAWRRHRPKKLKDLAQTLGISIPAVSKWPYVPRQRVDAVARHLGLSRDDLRPDLIRDIHAGMPMTDLYERSKGTL